MQKIEYNRAAAVEYAAKWANGRNPEFMNFDGMGGDCTNFISQCILAGGGVMNYTKDVGWYYNSPNDRAAAWSGAQYLNNFLLKNEGVGPHAVAVPLSSLIVGDIIQLHNGLRFYHSLMVMGFDSGVPLIAAHTDDSYMRPLNTYHYVGVQGVHITGIYTN